MSLQRRLLPRPIFSVVLLAMWLLAFGSISPGHILLGGLFALAVPALFQEFWPEAPALKSVSALVSYLFVVGFDIVVANLNVARLILGPNDNMQPAWLEIPLDIDHPYAISILASSISLTPGTVSSNLSGTADTLLVHALDCPDEEAEIERIKSRYEARLKEVFE
ncbi:MAG: Na+/H+ antiporter subunit E [Persicimonas sp.]